MRVQELWHNARQKGAAVPTHACTVLTTLGPGGQIMVAVRSTLRLEVPLVHARRVLVSPEYVATLTELANAKFDDNFARIARFLAACREALTPVAKAVVEPAATHSATTTAAPAAAAAPSVWCVVCAAAFASRNKLFAHVAAAHPKPAE
jgi:hypothetical protein